MERYQSQEAIGELHKVKTPPLKSSAIAPIIETTATGLVADSQAATIELKDASNPLLEDELYSVFSKKQKMFIAIMVTFGAVISPISGAIYYPALGSLAADFHVSIGAINLTITTYMIVQGLAPMFVGAFADNGHRPAFLVCNIIYIIANVALALQNSYPVLLVLRMLQSAGSSGTIALRNGVIASIFSPAERAGYLGMVNAANLWAPALGPLIGGALVETLGWRSIFWGLAIVTFAYTLLYALLIPETARKVVGNGTIPAQHWYNNSGLQLLRGSKHLAASTKLSNSKMQWPNPINTLLMFREPDIAINFFFGGIVFGCMYGIMASLPIMLTHEYHLTVIQLSLCYMPLGIGAALGAVISGKILNYNWKRIAIANGLAYDKKRNQNLRHFPIERARLGAIFPALIVGSITLITFGWSVQYHANLAAPLIINFVGGVALVCCFSGLSNLLVDCYPEAPSQATAANNIARCLMGAAATGLIEPMLNHMGYGWTWTFLGLLSLATSPLLWVQLKWGPKWREERAVRVEAKEKAEQEAKAMIDGESIKV